MRTLSKCCGYANTEMNFVEISRLPRREISGYPRVERVAQTKFVGENRIEEEDFIR